MRAAAITRVGIVGAGTMGSRIAYQCVLHGKEAYIFDTSPAALEQAVTKNRQWLAQTTKAGEVQAAISRLNLCATLAECVDDVELVVETVPEDLELKRQVFTQIDHIAPPDVLIVTNSSSIPSSSLAEVTTRPDKVLNVNFNDPLHDELLVEVMGHSETAPKSIAAVETFVRSIKMVPIVIKREIMGFAFNRIWRAVKREALHLVDGGYADFEDIDRAWMLSFGSHWGPFGRMDEIGIDVVRDIEMRYYLQSDDDRDKPPEFLDRFIAQGRLGVKSDRGFYTYPDPEYTRPGWLRKEAPWTPDQTIRLD